MSEEFLGYILLENGCHITDLDDNVILFPTVSGATEYMASHDINAAIIPVARYTEKDS